MRRADRLRAQRFINDVGNRAAEDVTSDVIADWRDFGLRGTSKDTVPRRRALLPQMVARDVPVLSSFFRYPLLR